MLVHCHRPKSCPHSLGRPEEATHSAERQHAVAELTTLHTEILFKLSTNWQQQNTSKQPFFASVTFVCGSVVLLACTVLTLWLPICELRPLTGSSRNLELQHSN
jgi:hypothetical protein